MPRFNPSVTAPRTPFAALLLALAALAPGQAGAEKVKLPQVAPAQLVKAPSPGFNTVLVGHDDPFEAATGHYPEPQGKLVLLKPDGRGGFTLVGGIGPDQWWATLAGQARPR